MLMVPHFTIVYKMVIVALTVCGEYNNSHIYENAS